MKIVNFKNFHEINYRKLFYLIRGKYRSSLTFVSFKLLLIQSVDKELIQNLSHLF
jgi:hypothetical protein